MSTNPKILLLDIETSPNLAYVWSLFRENVPLARLVESSEVLCWSAKWLDDKQVVFGSIHTQSRLEMLHQIWVLLNEADVVVHYNGLRFDIPALNTEFLRMGFLPPSPYKQVDLYKTVKAKFKFVSNKLGYVVKRLGLGEKIETDFTLWVDCMNQNSESWAKMEEYNKNDVLILEKLYNLIRAWAPNHPNMVMYNPPEEGTAQCPVCGEKVRIQARGFAYTNAGRYQRYRCMSCGKWFRGTKNTTKKPFVNIL